MAEPLPDERMANAIRHAYRPLSDEEKLQMTEVKDIAADFISACGRIGRSRELSLAITNMQQASFWAVQHITGDKTS